jgi:uncharacterized protein YbjT (DUF2867 family)
MTAVTMRENPTMPTTSDLILVTGATGHQGGAIAAALLARGHSVRAMTRKPDSAAARALASQGAVIVQGDLDDPASIERALKGAWGALGVQNSWEAGVVREEAQGKRFAELARRTGIQHFVYQSVGSAQRSTGIPHFDNKWRVEETVRNLGFPSYTIIRPVFFMENWLSPSFKPGIDQGAVMMSLRPETRLQMIAVADIGQYGRLAFERSEALNGRALDIAGDALTMPEVARVVSEVTGRPIAFRQVPIEEVRKFSGDFATMLEWFDAVGYDADIRGLEKEFRIRPASFREWASAQQWS